jgi:crotonobetainyl-CoA hydratase
VIAAVNGLAMGGGFELALAADLMLASDTAEFALPEVKLGMVADSGGVLRLPQRLPRPLAMELMLTGRRMRADEALRWGLLNQVTPADGLMDAARSLAQQIVQAAPLAVAAVKEIVSATEGQDLQSAYQTLRNGALPTYRTMLRSQDAAEGPLAFSEKRPPRWTGQ